ncbi:hypothetical protein SLE2022_060170 [Rubroshorea leprosula]
MTDDRRWMYKRQGPHGDCDVQFFNGLQQFFDFVYSHPGVHPNNEIRYLTVNVVSYLTITRQPDEAKSLTTCALCGEDRDKRRNPAPTWKKDKPRNCLRYLPIIPRLQRLYMSHKTAEHMTWHLKCRVNSKVIIHPAWKHFNEVHPSFARDPRNVRIGLATDKFNLWGHSLTSFSCWPAFIVVHNLPPEMCMHLEFTFLTLVISGPKNPGKNIDVFLRPLIDNLK